MPQARIKVSVQPRASKTEVVGMHGDSLRVRLAAPPVDNAANEALIAFVAEILGIPKKQVRVAAGVASRQKLIEIDGATSEGAMASLLQVSKAAKR